MRLVLDHHPPSPAHSVNVIGHEKTSYETSENYKVKVTPASNESRNYSFAEKALESFRGRHAKKKGTKFYLRNEIKHT